MGKKVIKIFVRHWHKTIKHICLLDTTDKNMDVRTLLIKTWMYFATKKYTKMMAGVGRDDSVYKALAVQA